MSIHEQIDSDRVATILRTSIFSEEEELRDFPTT